MINDNILDVFSSMDKAIHHCTWLNFKYRIVNKRFGIIEHPEFKYAVCDEVTAKERGDAFLDILPEDYSDLDYFTVLDIRQELKPIPHWIKLLDMVSTADEEILRFVLYTKIPFERLIRFELARRCYDENHRLISHEESRALWLKYE